MKQALQAGTKGEKGAGTDRGRRRNSPANPGRRWKRWVFGVPLALIMPFVILVRLSAWFYSDGVLGPWMAVAGGASVAFVLLGVTITLIAVRFRRRPGKRTVQALIGLFTAYTLYLLVFVSASNVKTPELRQTYTALNPVLRLAVSSFLLLDRAAVLTDTAREAADYAKMGLNTPRSSMHYEQASGYVHAVDLRTNDRSELRNVLTAAYFRVMGFSTLRHTGTADHLHVSLRIPDGSGPGS